MGPMHLLSVNLGRATAVDCSDAEGGMTGIGKRPVPGPVRVSAPGPKATGRGSGLAGDAVCDRRHHGGDHQAVYAYAREDLDWWEAELGRALPPGLFGENLTTTGVDLSGAVLGERWRVGPELVLEVSSTRIPCRTFQGVLGEPGWVRRFTRECRPGAYLRVVREGPVSPATGSRSPTAPSTRSPRRSSSAPGPPNGPCCRASSRRARPWHPTCARPPSRTRASTRGTEPSPRAARLRV